MKKFFSTALITLSLLAHANVCSAQTLSADKVKSLAAVQIKKDMAKYKLDEVEVNITNITPDVIELPEGKVTVKVTSNSSGLNPREYRKISIFVNNRELKTIYAPVEIKAYKTVLTAKELISKDKAISTQNVELKRADVIRNIEEVLTEEDLSKALMTKKVFYPGEVLSRKYTAARPDILKDAIVAVNFKTDNSLTVVVEGIALTSGNRGDVIRVKNKRLNKIYTGTVVGENRVEIQI